MVEQFLAIVSLCDVVDFGFDCGDVLVVGASVCVLPVVVQPLALVIEEGDDCWDFFRFSVWLMAGCQLFLPAVGERLEFVLPLVGLKDHAILVDHG